MFKLELRPCTKYYQQALGIPCAYILSNRLPPDDPETRKRVFPELQPLEMNNFIPQWRLESMQWVEPQPAPDNPAIITPEAATLDLVPSQPPATDNGKLARALVQIAGQQGRLPTHQQIEVLDQLRRLADGDLSGIRAVLEPAVVKSRGRPKEAKNKSKRKAQQHEASTR
jgi:hypothetical protein